MAGGACVQLLDWQAPGETRQWNGARELNGEPLRDSYWPQCSRGDGSRAHWWAGAPV